MYKRHWPIKIWQIIVLLGSALFIQGCGDGYSVVPVAKKVMVGPQWTEIRPAKPLTWPKPDEEIAFCLPVKYTYTDNENLEIILPDGQHFMPEIELVDADGKIFPLNSHGFLGEEIFYDVSGGHRELKSVMAIRIRTNVPMEIDNLIWREFDFRKVKR